MSKIKVVAISSNTELKQRITINNEKNIYLDNMNKSKKILNIKEKMNIIPVLRFLLVLCLFQILSTNKRLFIESQYSKITLKIKGPGRKNIFGHDPIKNEYFEIDNYPNEIYINEDIQNIANYSYDFNQTINIVKLIWNKTKINSTKNMFRRCSDITEIDFSEFDTSPIIDMYCMFFQCSSLTSLNLSNFNTSNTINMAGMFQDCSSLTSLNLSKFDTSHVIWMHVMFGGCSSLTSLDLSNFDTSQVYHIFNMFDGCINLKYINLQNFNEISLSDDFKHYNQMFRNTLDNIVICINETKIVNKIISQINNKSCSIIDCSDDWKFKQKKLIYETDICIDNCNNSNEYKYEYNGKCYNSCPNGLIGDDEYNRCKCSLEQCLICPPEEMNITLCMECNANYYPIENDTTNTGEYFNCYKEPEGYYLDQNLQIYKICYFRCKTCEIKGDNINHNCLKCKEDYPYQVNVTNNYTNCYENDSYYNISDINSKTYIINQYSENSESASQNLINNENLIQRSISINPHLQYDYKCEIGDELNNICFFSNITNNTEILKIIKDNINSIYNQEIKKVK